MPARQPGLVQQLLCAPCLALHHSVVHPLIDPPQRHKDLPPLLRVQRARLLLLV